MEGRMFRSSFFAHLDKKYALHIDTLVVDTFIPDSLILAMPLPQVLEEGTGEQEHYP